MWPVLVSCSLYKFFFYLPCVTFSSRIKVTVSLLCLLWVNSAFLLFWLEVYWENIQLNCLLEKVQMWLYIPDFKLLLLNDLEDFFAFLFLMWRWNFLIFKVWCGKALAFYILEIQSLICCKMKSAFYSRNSYYCVFLLYLCPLQFLDGFYSQYIALFENCNIVMF